MEGPRTPGPPLEVWVNFNLQATTEHSGLTPETALGNLAELHALIRSPAFVSAYGSSPLTIRLFGTSTDEKLEIDSLIVNPAIRIEPWVLNGQVYPARLQEESPPNGVSWSSCDFPRPPKPGAKSELVLITRDNVTLDGIESGGICIEGHRGMGIVISNAANGGCTALPGPNNIEIRNLKIHWIAQSTILARSYLPPSPIGVPLVRPEPTSMNLEIAHNDIAYVNHGFNVPSGTLFKTEAISDSHYGNCEVHHNKLANFLQEGIDFKVGTWGSIHNNLVEYGRAAGIYLNESGPTKVYQNTIGYMGWYEQRDSTGVTQATFAHTSRPSNYSIPHYAATGVIHPLREINGNAIVVLAGDLCTAASTCPTIVGPTWLETGKIAGIDVTQNEIYWTLGQGIFVSHRWARGTQCGASTSGLSMVIDDIMIEHNTIYQGAAKDIMTEVPWTACGGAMQQECTSLMSMPGSTRATRGRAAIAVWEGCTNTIVRYNIVSDSENPGFGPYSPQLGDVICPGIAQPPFGIATSQNMYWNLTVPTVCPLNGLGSGSTSVANPWVAGAQFPPIPQHLAPPPAPTLRLASISPAAVNQITTSPVFPVAYDDQAGLGDIGAFELGLLPFWTTGF
ncbi:MAG: right-handed parallel beta-helix repeat-containing protein [Planctomycetota bacterium]